MLKSLVDIDVRKVSAFLVPLAFICTLITSNPTLLNDAVPSAWIPHIQAWAGIIAAVATGITGSHNIAALMSPKAPS